MNKDIKILAAFDSFKESMTAYQAGEAVKQVYKNTIIKPLADGGEGSIEAIKASLKGETYYLLIKDALYEDIIGSFYMSNEIAIIESAKAVGLEMINQKDLNGDVLNRTTYGIGQMIDYAYQKGARLIYITLGGTSTNDAGIGILEALGAKFYSEDKLIDGITPNKIKEITRIDWKNKYKEAKFIGLCDVTNPLLKENGASAIFGPQKGKIDIKQADQLLEYFTKLSEKTLNKPIETTIKGMGAAGGLGFFIHYYLNGQLISGFDAIAKIIELEKAIQEADIIFTGEGKMDKQTLQGKTPLGVLTLAKKYHKPVYAFCGKLEDKDLLLKAGFKDIYQINHSNKPLSELLKEGYQNLKEEVKRHEYKSEKI